MKKEVESPCKARCFYNHEDDHCSTCFRTLEEIGAWWKLSDRQKREVLKKSRRRRRGSGRMKEQS